VICGQPLQTLSLVRGILAKKIKDNTDEEALMLVARLNEAAGALLGMLDTLQGRYLIFMSVQRLRPQDVTCAPSERAPATGSA
jgi:hypothetical protein